MRTTDLQEHFIIHEQKGSFSKVHVVQCMPGRLTYEENIRYTIISVISIVAKMMDAEKDIFLKQLLSIKEDCELLLKPSNLQVTIKNVDKSSAAGLCGLLRAQSQNHDSVTHQEILQDFCMSVAMAPNDSEELAFAYLHRSVFLMHLEKFDESIKDIDKALHIATLCDSPVNLKIQLLCTKAKCFSALEFEKDKVVDLLAEATFLANLIKNQEERDDNIKFITESCKVIKHVKQFFLERKEKETTNIEDEEDNSRSITASKEIVEKHITETTDGESKLDKVEVTKSQKKRRRRKKQNRQNDDDEKTADEKVISEKQENQSEISQVGMTRNQKRKMRRRKQREESIDDKFTDIFNSVKIEYTEKYGRHLIANQDFKPGDIVFTEDVYASCLNEQYVFTHCHYCNIECWSGIPCDNCIYAMFCSEECKRNAMDKFHKIECFIIPFINKTVKWKISYDQTYICLRILIMGIIEAGGIEKLKAELKLIDECKDKCWKGLKSGDKIDLDFKSVYSLNSEINPELYDTQIYKNLCNIMCIYTILLCRSPLVLKHSIDAKRVEDLMKNDNFIFIGSLLIKLLNIKTLNCFAVDNIYGRKCKLENSNEACSDGSCCKRGTYIAVISSLINHSCFPNVNTCFTNNQIIIYALLPIKKGSQLFISYGVGFDSESRTTRRDYLSKYYNFICDCVPCTSNWLALDETSKAFTVKYCKTVEKICTSLNELEVLRPISTYRRDHLECVSNLIMKVFEESKAPSPVMHTLLPQLNKVFAAFNSTIRNMQFRDCKTKKF